MSALDLSKIAIIFGAFSSSKNNSLSVMLGLQALNLNMYDNQSSTNDRLPKPGLLVKEGTK